MQEEPGEWHHHRLCRGEEHDVRRQLAGVDVGRIDRRGEEAREAVVLALEEEAALDAGEAREDEAHPEDRGRERGRRLGRGVVRHGEDHQEEHAEHEDARQALARAPLDAQVLREDGERAAHGQARPATTAW